MYVCMLTEIITCVYRQSTITTSSLPVQANTATSQQSETNLGNSNNNNDNNNNNNIMKGSLESQHRNNGAVILYACMYVCMYVCMYLFTCSYKYL